MILGIAQIFFFAFFGVMARSFIWKDATVGDIVGFPIFITMLSLLFSTRLTGVSEETLWGMAGVLGIFLPALKDFMKGNKLLKVAVRTMKGVKSASDSLLDEVEKEL